MEPAQAAAVDRVLEAIESLDFETSPHVGMLAKALAAAQGKIANAAADSTNPHFQSKYADLASIIDAIRVPLSEEGIARHQALMSRGKEVGVRTSLIHSSGEWIASTVWCAAPGTPQGLGLTVTYLRRYGLAAAVGLAQDDDDAESAEGRSGKGRSKPAAPPAAKLDPKVQARIKILQAKLAISDDEWRAKLDQFYGVASSAALTADQAQDLIGRLEALERMRDKAAQSAPMSPKTSQ